jgi:serine protease AprX
VDFGITAVHDDVRGTIPALLEVPRSYPNPFHGCTTLTYSVPLGTTVSIIIYNQLGEMVATPVHELQTPGEHSAALELPKLPSGVYTYRIFAGLAIRTGRMSIVQ